MAPLSKLPSPLLNGDKRQSGSSVSCVSAMASSTSWSCCTASAESLGTRKCLRPDCSISETEASLFVQWLWSAGKRSARETSPCHTSSQNEVDLFCLSMQSSQVFFNRLELKTREGYVFLAKSIRLFGLKACVNTVFSSPPLLLLGPPISSRLASCTA